MKRSSRTETETPAFSHQIPELPSGSRGSFKTRRHLVDGEQPTEANLIPTDNLQHRQDQVVEPEIDVIDATGQDLRTRHQQEIPSDAPVPAPRVRPDSQARQLRRLDFKKVRGQEAFVRGQYFIEFVDINITLIEQMQYLDAFNFISILANQLHFSHLETLEAMEKYQADKQRIVPIFQVLIPMYETYCNSIDVALVYRLRQVRAVLVSLFMSPVLRERGVKLQILEIAKHVFGLGRAQYLQFKSELL